MTTDDIERHRMAERSLLVAQERAQRAYEDLEKAQARLEAVDNEPKEPRKGSIIRFDTQFAGKGETYTYVAFRAPNGDWYRTGTAAPVSWSELIEFMYRDYTARRLGVGFWLYNNKGRTWVGRAR